MEYLKNITRFGLNFTFLANVVGSSYKHIRKTRPDGAVSVLSCLHIPLLIALDYNFNESSHSLWRNTWHLTKIWNTTHTHTHKPPCFHPGLSGTRLWNVFKIAFISLSWMYQLRPFLCINLESLTKNSLINSFSPISSIFFVFRLFVCYNK